MIVDRALGLGTPKREAFYFILLADSIQANDSTAQAVTEVKFAVYKGD